MKNVEKTQEQLFDEIAHLNHRITELEQVEDSLQLFTERLKILYQINQGILVARSTTDIAQVALRWIRQLIPCHRVGITLLDPRTNQLEVIALDVDGKTLVPPGTSLNLDQIYDSEYLVAQLSKDRIVTREVGDINGERDFFYDLFKYEGLRVFTILPLIYEGELFGAMALSWRDPYTLSKLQEEIAREVVVQLSVAIRQTQLREAEQRRRKELELLERVSTALRYVASQEDLFNILVEEFNALFGMDFGVVLVTDNKVMKCVHAFGSEVQKLQINTNENVINTISELMFQGGTHLVPGIEVGLPEVASVEILPFQSQQEILGGAVLCWTQPRIITEEETHLLITVADVAGIALHRMNILEALEQQVTNRTRELSAVYEVTAVASSSLELQEILDQSLSRVVEAMMSDIGILLLLDEAGQELRLVSCQGVDPQAVHSVLSMPNDYKLAYEVLKHRQAVVISDLAHDPKAPEIARGLEETPLAGVPIRVKDRILGVLIVIGKSGSVYSAEAVSLLISIADHIGIAIENAHLYKQAQQAAILAERQRLARDLHDSVTQSLYSLNLMAGTGQKLLQNSFESVKIAHLFDRLVTTAHQALKEMRLLVYELRPSALEKEGLVGALRHRLDAVEGRADIETHLYADELPALPAYIEDGLFHIVQEALNNALKHSDSQKIDVSLRVIEDTIALEVRDYGVGFNIEQPGDHRGIGLTSMRERARIIGSELKITSEPGHGTCVAVSVLVNQGGVS